MIGSNLVHRKVGDDVDPEQHSHSARPNSGSLQDGGAVLDAGADHDLVGRRSSPLSCGVEISDALGAVAFEQDSIDMASGADGRFGRERAKRA